MKRIVTIGLCFYFVATILVAQTTATDITDITGTWHHNTFYYVFGDTGIMSEIQVDGEPLMYNAYYYEFLSSAVPPLIRYGKDLSDSTQCSYLLVTDIEDTTAIIAHGTPFARTGDSEGLRGTWTYADDLTVINWEFGTDTVSYSHKLLDLNEGVFVTDEYHEGTFTKGRREQTGRFFLSFTDGTIATIYPLIADNIMYLFDLTGRRSKFIRTQDAPSYIDYKDAQAFSP